MNSLQTEHSFYFLYNKDARPVICEGHVLTQVIHDNGQHFTHIWTKHLQLS